jgi:hypothetical protein
LPESGTFDASKSGMKTSLKFLFVLIAVAALSVAYPAKADLITNGGFETGDFTGWTVSGARTVTGPLFGTSPHSGNYQASFLTSGSLTQTLATMAGQSYTIDFFLAKTLVAPAPGLTSFALQWDGATIFSLTSHPFQFGYTEYMFNVTASTSSTNLSFIFGTDASTAWFLDDVSVNAVGVPDGGSTVMLLGAALGALGMVRRFLMG